MLQNAVDINALAAVAVGGLQIHTLQFADDTLLFFDGSLKSAATIKLILDVFADCSGLKINFSKSSIIPLNLSAEQTSLLSHFLGCKSQDFPITHLGLPLSPRALVKGDYLPLIERIDNKLASWKRMTLSSGGRLVLLNSVLSSIPTYFCSVFQLPIWVENSIDKIRRGFFWRGKKLNNGFHCLIKWDNVCRPKDLGGVGIRNLRCMNSALLMKGLWRFYSLPSLPWVQLLRHKHYKLKPLSAASRKPTGCSPLWNGLLKLAAPFFASISVRLGNGTNTSFWNARWCDEATLCFRFPTLSSTARLQHASVSVWLSRFTPRLESGFKPPLTTAGLEELQQLAGSVTNISLSSDEDLLSWRWCRDGKFTVQSAYNLLSFGGVKGCLIPFLWKLKAPLRIKIFLWIAARNRILTADVLAKRGWHGPSICVLCTANDENLEHILFGCRFAKATWSILLHCIPTVKQVMLDQPGDVAIRWCKARNTQSGRSKSLFDLCFAATCWEIWKERNSRIFNNRLTRCEEVSSKIITCVNLWTSVLGG